MLNTRPLLIGVLSLSTLGASAALAAEKPAATAEKPAATAENQDARETKLVMLKLPGI